MINGAQEYLDKKNVNYIHVTLLMQSWLPEHSLLEVSLPESFTRDKRLLGLLKRVGCFCQNLVQGNFDTGFLKSKCPVIRDSIGMNLVSLNRI